MSPDIVQHLVTIAVGLVVIVVIGTLVRRLKATEPTIKNPMVKAAADQVIETLQQLQAKLGPDGAAVAPALDAAFHNHAVVVGEPHEDDPRAP